MRWWIAALLALNIVVFLWQGVVRPPGKAARPSPLPDIGEIRLLSELEPATSPQDNDVQEPTDESGILQAAALLDTDEPTASSDQSAEETDKETMISPAVKEDARTVASPVSDSSSTLGNISPNEELGAGVASAGATGSAPKGAEPETPQLGEVAREPVPHEIAGTAAGMGKTHPGETGDERQPVVAVEQLCWRLGPFESLAQAQALVPELPDGVEKLAFQEETLRLPNGFFVLIPATGNRTTALEVAQRLKKAGIRDFWVFIRGPLKNAISLGMFSREANAKRRLKAVEDKGFAPEIRPRYREVKRTALLVTALQSEAVQRSLENLNANQLQRVPCP